MGFGDGVDSSHEPNNGQVAERIVGAGTMYLRPRSPFEKFLVHEKITRLDEIGRQVVEFKPTGEILFGVISITNATEVEKYKALRHEVSHTIVQRGGRIMARVGDLLVKEDGKYLAGGQWYYYWVNRRNDL